MKLTCVTATFNCIKTGNRDRLIRCVESIAKLKIEHEHLIYDGASTDGTVELLRELESGIPGLKVISEPDTGIYNAFNKGVRDARGEWYYVLGADDYISHPDVMDRLVSEENSSYQVIVAPVEIDGEFPYPLYGKPSDLKWILWRNPHSHQGLIMKRDLVRRLGELGESDRVVNPFVSVEEMADRLVKSYGEDMQEKLGSMRERSLKWLGDSIKSCE